MQAGFTLAAEGFARSAAVAPGVKEAAENYWATQRETAAWLHTLVESRETFYEMLQPRYSSARPVSSTKAFASCSVSNL
jgi:hypothetical protein